LVGGQLKYTARPLILTTMTKKADWKIKREERLKKLIPWAQRKLRSLGYRSEIEGYAVVFRVGVCKVKFYPFTGGIQWEGTVGIKERGMKNLIKLIKEHEKSN